MRQTEGRPPISTAARIRETCMGSTSSSACVREVASRHSLTCGSDQKSKRRNHQGSGPNGPEHRIHSVSSSACYLRENDGNPTAVDSHKSIKAPVVERPPPPLLSVCSQCERYELMITAASGRDSSEFVITSVRHPGGSGKLRSCVYGNYNPSFNRSFVHSFHK